ncbi:hypothetical protein MAXJ12_20207 [Mesorhizobium alhagi CCNWXJ12-2]|uniref:Uncharacterized protein n=1 Tax=Mesorhizobium alhagi CCNWXJ12-2 TaxID=1107882 RepID=H0HV38_9HYPH|nr:hypothetical protein MAXJ12_20207 [Mesorhizobium alhagi CCNWXJ12-2]
MCNIGQFFGYGDLLIRIETEDGLASEARPLMIARPLPLNAGV